MKKDTTRPPDLSYSDYLTHCFFLTVWLWHLSANCWENKAGSLIVCMWPCVWHSCCTVRVLFLCVQLHTWTSFHKNMWCYCKCVRGGCLYYSVYCLEVSWSLYLFHLSWHTNPSIWKCEMRGVASDWEEIWGAVIFRMGSVSLHGINLRWKRSAL